MMRCRKHFSDLTSTRGVCASCLRQRLFALLASQSQLQFHSQTQSQTDDDENDIIKLPVSPHRKSDEACKDKNQMFFTPPQPTTVRKTGITSMIMGFLFGSKKHDQGHLKKESRTFSIDEKVGGRGMSPEQTPRRTPAGGVRRNNRNVSGFAVCLSPLVRASPNVSHEYCKNRSRKLADFGKNNNNY